MHKVEEIAKDHHEDPASLVDFALNNEDKFGIKVVDGDVLVSSFFIDELINDFRSEGDEYIVQQFFFPETLAFSEFD